jgi:chromosome partitioning protein
MHTLTLAASKGGVGKTTLTSALAVEAAKKLHVGLYDIDPQQSLARWHELRDDGDRISIIVARSTEEALAVATEQGCDLLIIDTPPALMLAIQPAIEVADLVVIPCKPSPIDVESIDPTVELAQTAGRPFVFVVNMVPTQGGAGLTKGTREFLKFNGDVMPQAVSQRLAYTAAMASGQSGAEVEKDKKCAGEIQTLWRAISRKLAGLGK